MKLKLSFLVWTPFLTSNRLKLIVSFLTSMTSEVKGHAIFNPTGIGGEGGVGFHHHLSIFLIAQKEIKITCSFLLTFNKIELGIFCQKIKVIGLILAFQRPFLQLDLENHKMKNAILGVKNNFRPTVYFNFFWSSYKNTYFHQFPRRYLQKWLLIVKTNFARK